MQYTLVAVWSKDPSEVLHIVHFANIIKLLQIDAFFFDHTAVSDMCEFMFVSCFFCLIKGFYYFCFSNGIVINNKSKLAPIVKSSTAQNLTLTNVGLHNKKDAVHEDKVDLDQTTMIGSALDLDSLESGEDSASLAAPNNGNLLKGIDKKNIGRYEAFFVFEMRVFQVFKFSLV